MRERVAIVGSGPTAIYALQELLECSKALEIVIFERCGVAGKGTPYQREINDPAMLSNIPSIEIPELPTCLDKWLRQQPDDYLDSLDIVRSKISDRTFYPRVVIGDFFRAQFETLIQNSTSSKHVVVVHENCLVSDIKPAGDRFEIMLGHSAILANAEFDYVVIATGHSFPSEPESSPGFFEAPWPATALECIPSGNIGILGTSLSAIDALVTISTKFGAFTRNGVGELEFHANQEGSSLNIVMMSRKGLLPEADFFFPIPYDQPKVCTQAAVDERVALGSSGLLDDLFDLFREEISASDPDYAQSIGLDALDVDTFAAAYYGVRNQVDPFEWAAANLSEATSNYQKKHTIAWRYAILITHEIIESAVGSLNADDLARFNRSFKSIFADDYATVPHLSIERLLALHRAGFIEIKATGDKAEITREGLDRGAVVTVDGQPLHFDTFINATGQKTLSARELPFPSLVEKGLISEARTLTPRGNQRRTGGIDVDEQCRPLVAGIQPVRRLYVPAVSYLLHKRPFVQGITSAAELGKVVAASIVSDAEKWTRRRRTRTLVSRSAAA